MDDDFFIIRFFGRFFAKVISILITLVGLGMVATGLAFASMIDDSFQGAAWWIEYWAHLQSGGGLREFLPWIALTALGACLFFLTPSPWSWPADEGKSKSSKNTRDEEV